MSRHVRLVLLVALATVVTAVVLWHEPPGDFRKQAIAQSQPVRNVGAMVLIPAGEFSMGSQDGPPYEGPVHRVKLNSFSIDKTEVTVAQFRQFVQATKYVTDAEKFGWSGVFDLAKKEWGRVDGAN